MRLDPTERPAHVVTPRLVMGLAIALIGVVLVLDRMNLAVASQVLRFWPAVVILIGALIFAQSRKVGGGVNGVVVMVIGGWLLLNSLGIVRLRFWELFWPMILILVGTVLVVQTLKQRSRAAAGAEADDTITVFAALSGVKRSSAARRFRGGEISLFMGGGHIDLREATIPRGEEAVLDIFAVMGGCDIMVPPSWSVETPLVPLMGNVEDKRVSAVPQGIEAASGGLAPPRLVLRGLVMLGGVVIRG